MRFQLAEIDRAFYEHLRIAIVAQGLLPDITAYADAESYATALQAINNPIEIFGVGNQVARGRVKDNKIVIDRILLQKGNIGALSVETHTAYEEGGVEKRRRERFPSSTYNITYQIGYTTNNIESDRILHQIILDKLGGHGFLNGIKQDGTMTESKFHYDNIDYRDMSSGDYTERIFRYAVKDVFISENAVLEEGLSPLIDFQPDIQME